MSSIIKIKRSTTKGAPSGLAAGELAYSGAPSGTVVGGDRLYIGVPGIGNAVSVVPIGGRYYTDIMSATPGTLTANKAVIVDADSKIDQLKINDLYLNNAQVTTGTTNTNLELNANGTGLVKFYDSTQSFTLPRSRGSVGYVLTMQPDGVTEWRETAAKLKITAQQGADREINLLTDILTINGSTGIETSFIDNVLTIAGTDATYSIPGIASFSASDFNIDSTANVTIKEERIQDIIGIGLIGNGLSRNAGITVNYDDAGNALVFTVATATVDNAVTPKAGIARFNHNFFQFGTSGDIDLVSLTANVVKSVTVGSTPLTIDANAITVNAGAGTGISVGAAGSTITISGIDAGANTKGVAKFSASYFDMGTAGDVKITAAGEGATKGTAALGLASFNNTNFNVDGGYVSTAAVTLGATNLTLGGTTTAVTGITSLGVGHFTITGGSITNNTTDEDINIDPSGLGQVKINNTWYLPNTKGDSDDQVLTINHTTGYATWASPKTAVGVYGDATNATLTVGLGSLYIYGGDGLDTSVVKVDDNIEITVAGTKATTSDYGVAKYNATEFNLDTPGTVTLKNLGIANGKLTNSAISIGSTSIALGASSNTLAGLTSIAFSTLKIGGTGGNLPKTISTSSGTNDDLYLSPDRTGGQRNLGGRVRISDAYSLPNYDGTNGQTLLTDGQGNAYWDTPAVTLKLHAESGDDSTHNGTINLITDTLSILGGIGITSYLSDAGNSFTLDADYAKTDGTVGVSTYSANFFDVSNVGLVTLVDAGAGKGIPNSKLINSSITVGTTAIALGSSSTTLAGITSAGIGNLTVSSNQIAATNAGANGDINLNTKGNGLIYLYAQAGGKTWTLPNDLGADGKVLTTDGAGTATWRAPVTTLKVAGDLGLADDTTNLIDETFSIKGGIGVKTTLTNNLITINANYASDVAVGVASFAASQFTVGGTGAVTLKDEGIQDIVGAMLTGDGFFNTHIEVGYDDVKGKLHFAVPLATNSVPGVASFDSRDFGVDSSGIVTLDGSILKSISVDDGTVTPSNHVLTIHGDTTTGTNVNHSGSTINLTNDLATSTQLGVAKFPTTQFTVTSGSVAVKTATTSIAGVASFASGQFFVDGGTGSGTGAVTIKTQVLGDQTISPGGSDITSINGLTQITAGTVKISTNLIENTGVGTTISIKAAAVSGGNIDANGARITGIGTPTADYDAVTKLYVDAARSGLVVKDPARVATLTAIADLTVTTTTASAPIIDGIQISNGSRILVKNQGTTDPGQTSSTHVDNGIYVWYGTDDTSQDEILAAALINGHRYIITTSGTTNWMSGGAAATTVGTVFVYNGATFTGSGGKARLVGYNRTLDADQQSEIVAGMFLFVQDGDILPSTGWVLQTTGVIIPGTTAIRFVQFSAAGTIIVGANSGLTKTGQEINVNPGDGLTIVANKLQLSSTIAGDGLTFSDNTINVVGTTDRITVNANSIDISASYAGQASITTVGTIVGGGVWNATAISPLHGGTGLTSFNKGAILVGNSSNGLTALSVGTAGKFLQVNDAGDDLVYGDIDGGTYE
jgi:hypothetical protein